MPGHYNTKKVSPRDKAVPSVNEEEKKKKTKPVPRHGTTGSYTPYRD